MEAAVIGETRNAPGGGPMTVGEIERELARLRMDEGGRLGLRSSVLNLIVPAGESSAAEVGRLVSRLAEDFPSRTIVLISDPEEERASVDVHLSAYCALRSASSGGSAVTQVCAEQVTVHAEGAPAAHLESIAGPLLIPDLPTFLWYPGNLSAGLPPHLSGLIPLADRVIVDTGASSPAEDLLRHVVDILEDGTAIGDLQWAALTPWRTLIAGLFATPERSEALGDIELVEVLHGSAGESRALLLCGWLASSLGWRPATCLRSEVGLELTFSKPSGGEVRCELVSNAPDAQLRRVGIHAASLSCEVDCRRGEIDARATAFRNGEAAAEQIVRLGTRDPAALLSEELLLRGRDEVYESSLRAVAEVMAP